jgi:hypothetical protein
MRVLWAAAAAQDLYRPSPAAGVAGAPRAAGARSHRLPRSPDRTGVTAEA